MPDHLTSLTQHQRDHLIHHTHCGMLAFTDNLLKASTRRWSCGWKTAWSGNGSCFHKLWKMCIDPCSISRFPRSHRTARSTTWREEHRMLGVKCPERYLENPESSVDSYQWIRCRQCVRLHLWRGYRSTRRGQLSQEQWVISADQINDANSGRVDFSVSGPLY